MEKETRATENRMERALRPGTFIRYGASPGFVRGLDRVAKDLDRLVAAGKGERASELYETFIAACHEKAGEVDDSGGELGGFVQDLFAGWVRARQAANAEPEATVRVLVSWMQEDTYGFCWRLERHVTKEMDGACLAAFARVVRAKLDASAPDDGGLEGAPRRQWSDALEHILAAQGDAEAYLELSKASGLEASDCDVLARIHQEAGKLEDALSWVERGIDLARQERSGSGASYDLEKRQLLKPSLVERAKKRRPRG